MDMNRCDIFLYEKEGKFHFGCGNPFHLHGNLGLPEHFTIPTETEEVSMKLLSHDNGIVKIEITPKVDKENAVKGEPFIVEAEGNFAALGAEFDRLKG